MREWMSKNGGIKPLYHTEGWRWADDDPTEPWWGYGGEKGPMANEKAYGDYIVRYATALYANGVKFIMYMPSSDLQGVEDPRNLHWLDYGLVPRKIYAVQAGFAHICTPDAEIHKIQYFHDEDICAYVFKRRKDAVAVVWARHGAYSLERSLLKKVEVLDIFAERVAGPVVSITESPIYLQARSCRRLLGALAMLADAEREAPEM